jgi:hypothetical protein
MRKKTSLLYVLNTTTDSSDCDSYYGASNVNNDDYVDVNKYLSLYDDTRYCVTDVTGKWDAN